MKIIPFLSTADILVFISFFGFEIINFNTLRVLHSGDSPKEFNYNRYFTLNQIKKKSQKNEFNPFVMQF